MKKLLILIIPILLIFSSCVTQKACDRKFPPVANTEYIYDTIHDSTYVKEIVKDTVVVIKVGKDTVIHDTDTVYIKNGLVNSKPVTVKGELSEATSQVVNSKVLLTLKEHATELKIELKGVIVERDSYRLLYEKYYKESSKTKVVKENSGLAKVALWWFWLTVMGLISFLIIKLKLYKIFKT